MLIWVRHQNAGCFYLSSFIHSNSSPFFLSLFFFFYCTCLCHYEAHRVANIQLWSHFGVGLGENSRIP